MTKIPNDLKKVHQKKAELAKSHSDEFIVGFMEYMVLVDYEGQDPETVFEEMLSYLHTPRDLMFVDEPLSETIEELDLIRGFNYGKEYSQQAKFNYRD